ncbi:MAG: sugar ABC transporter substrate-binding protein [Anaerolineae bacterium]|nr:sugar ABC transporter substrate-binding protein [Anaerolineae bacterium]
MSQAAHWMVCIVICVACIAFVAPTHAQEDTPVIAPVPCKAPGKLTMWVWSANWQPLIQAAIDEWETTYCPGAAVDLQLHGPFGIYWGQLDLAARMGGTPDVFNINQPFFQDYAAAGRLLDLQPYWDEAGIDTTLWGPGLVDPYRWGEAGDLYAGPVNWDTVGVFYNKDMFDAAGLPVPPAGWDWDLFADYAAALTDPEAGVYGALAYVGFQVGYANWIASAGTTPVVEADRSRCTLADAGSIRALTFLRGLIDDGYMPSVTDMGEALGVETITEREAFQFWAEGRAAMLTGGSFAVPDALANVPFNWDVLPLPRHPQTGRSRSIVHAVGYAASATTADPDLAANLILYLVSDEAQMLFAEAGGVAPANPAPALQRAWITSLGATGSVENIDVFITATFDSQGVTVFGDIWDFVNGQIVIDLFSEEAPDIAEAARAACEYIDQHLPGTQD